jgi:hypothetical protein
MTLKKISVPVLVFIIVLLLVYNAFLFTTKDTTITMEESTSQPDDVVTIIIELRNLRAAAEIFRRDSLVNPDNIKPEIKLLAHYLENPARFTKTPSEYLFEEANGEWWVGYNLAATDKFSENREAEYERLKMMADRTIYGSMDINVPYNGEDIVFMLVR